MAFVNGVTRSGGEPVENLVAEIDAGGPGRWAAMAALAESGDKRAYATLAAYAASDDWTLRRAAIEAVGQRVDGGKAARLFRVWLSDPSSPVVRAACIAAAAKGLRGHWPELLALLDSPDAGIRAAALEALGALGKDEDMAAVLDIHRNDPDVDVRRAAALVLRLRARLADCATLVDLWRNDPLPEHRVWACDLAFQSGMPALVEKIRPLLHDPDGHVRTAAKRALGEISS